MKRFLLWALVCLVGIWLAFILLILIFYAEEDWRGAHDWADCQRELQAQGESLDLRQLVHTGKAEDDLSKEPLFMPLYQKEVDPSAPINQIDPLLKADDSIVKPRFSAYQTGKLIDLVAWQKFYRALSDSGLSGLPATPSRDILRVLARFDSEMEEIDSAVSNPQAYLPVDYEQPFTTHLGGSTAMLRPAKVLQVRAIARLNNNQSDLAEMDYLRSFHLEQPLIHRCFVVDYLVIAGIRVIDDSILWEGIHRHAWKAAQLREMETSLASADMLALAAKSLRAERGFGLQTIKFVQSGHYDLMADLSHTTDVNDWWANYEFVTFLKVRPMGWGLQERVFLAQELQKQIEAINESEGVVDPGVYRGWKDPKSYPDWKKINFAASLLLLIPYEKLGVNIARAETNRRLARLACRLEEYRLDHGNQYPDKLDDLPDLPVHLNQEVLSTQPLRYQRKGAGYLLYSVGWNQTDEGGYVAADKTEGDWVWPSP